MSNSLLLEVCLESIESAIAADRGGAQRIELCADLLEGGTTPSAGTIAATRERVNLGINVMIRPRGGDFLYSEAEFASMRHDIQIAKTLGADGIVLGLLNPDGTVDVERTRELVQLARPLPVTFHRAIDVSRDLFRALEDIIIAGCSRVLTSGGKSSVVDGAETVAKLVQQAEDRIIVMPGCGIRPNNILDIARKTRASELHIALDEPVQSGMQFRKTEIPMGDVEGREFLRFEASERSVREVVEVLNAVSAPGSRS